MLFIGIGALMQIGGEAPKKPSPAQQSESEEDKNAWIPSGFQAWNSIIAWRWGSQGEGPGCIGEQTCFRVEVVPRLGCGSLYVSATLLDKDGQNIGYTNDATQGVRAGEVAIMTLGTYEKAMDSMRIAEINCY